MSATIRAEYRGEFDAWLDATTEGLCAEARDLVRKKISDLYEEAVQAQSAADDEGFDVAELESHAHRAFMERLGTAEEGGKRWHDAFLSEKQEALVRRCGLLPLMRRPRLLLWAGFACLVAAFFSTSPYSSGWFLWCWVCFSGYSVKTRHPYRMAYRVALSWLLSLVALILFGCFWGGFSMGEPFYLFPAFLVGFLPRVLWMSPVLWRVARGKRVWSGEFIIDPFQGITDYTAKIVRATRFGPRRAELYRWAEAAGYGLPSTVKERIHTEIEGHYGDAIDDLRDEGNTTAQAHVKVMENLGDPKEAARGYAGYCFGEWGLEQLERVLARPPRWERLAVLGALLGVYAVLSVLHAVGHRYAPLPRFDNWIGSQVLLVLLTLWTYFFCYEAEHWAFFRQCVIAGLNRVLFVRPVGWLVLWLLLRIAWGTEPLTYAALATVLIGQGVKMLTVYVPLRRQIDHPREWRKPRSS